MSQPELGKQIVSRVKVRICKKCGYAINSTGLCTYGCDACANGENDYIVRVYHRVDTLIREEDADGNTLRQIGAEAPNPKLP